MSAIDWGTDGWWSSQWSCAPAAARAVLMDLERQMPGDCKRSFTPCRPESAWRAEWTLTAAAIAAGAQVLAARRAVEQLGRAGTA